ncbi:MAG: NAD(P)/FAD-dependent oxidoreductase [Candidatus Paceibacterota bacterium]
MKNSDVLVIGGGASGMMAAARASFLGKRVVVLEKNKSLGEKLKITGGGRCNITNAEFDTKVLLSHYGSADKFLHSPFSQFGVRDTFEFFESRGLPLKIEDRKRAFPKSEKALDVFRVLEKEMKANGVEVHTDSAVKKVVVEGRRIVSVETKNGSYSAEKIILATGGMSHPETGSTGDGFGWLRDMGHNVKAPTPDIVPLAIKEAWVKKLAGKSLDDAKIVFYCAGQKSFALRGRILATHFGISGPLILNAAGKVRDLLHSGAVTAQIDLFPTLNIGELEKKFINLFDANKNKLLKNVLPEILPSGFMPAFKFLMPDVDLDTKVHSVKKEVRSQIVRKLKQLELSVQGLLGNSRAVVSDGGVELSDIDMKTMRSKKIENLFVTGDLLHISRPSGGYSLQLCWTTGFIAGSDF